MEREDRATAVGVTIRPYRDGDAPALCKLFFRSVRDVGPAKYDDAQVRAWAAAVPDPTRWAERMRGSETYVAERDDTIAGWIEFERDGHLDMLYCAPEFAGRGVAARLYALAEARARELGVTRFFTDASRFAQSFFRKHGFALDYHEEIVRHGVVIQSARMSKTLTQRDES